MAPITYIPTFEAARMMAGGRGAGAYLPLPIWLKITGNGAKVAAVHKAR